MLPTLSCIHILPCSFPSDCIARKSQIKHCVLGTTCRYNLSLGSPLSLKKERVEIGKMLQKLIRQPQLLKNGENFQMIFNCCFSQYANLHGKLSTTRWQLYYITCITYACIARNWCFFNFIPKCQFSSVLVVLNSCLRLMDSKSFMRYKCKQLVNRWYNFLRP